VTLTFDISILKVSESRVTYVGYLYGYFSLPRHLLQVTCPNSEGSFVRNVVAQIPKLALLEKYHSITMVLIPWYFGAVGLYFTMVRMVNIPLQNTLILYLVNHSIFGGAFYSGSVLLPLPWYRN